MSGNSRAGGDAGAGGILRYGDPANSAARSIGVAAGYEADAEKRHDLRQDIHLQLWRSFARVRRTVLAEDVDLSRGAQHGGFVCESGAPEKFGAW